MPSKHDKDLFDRLCGEFDGLRFSDEELRLKRFNQSDPRHDARYRSGQPPSNVSLTGFEYFYEIPSVPGKTGNELQCMFGNHRHLGGAAFMFSDGHVRCAGNQCFNELALKTGKDVGRLRTAIRGLTERQGQLAWLDRTKEQISGELSKAHSEELKENCQFHDIFFDTFRKANPPAFKFAVKVSADQGQVLVSRPTVINKKRVIETVIQTIPVWQIFSVVPTLRYNLQNLQTSLSRLNTKLSQSSHSITGPSFKDLRQAFKGAMEDRDLIINRIQTLARFEQDENVEGFAAIWNTQAPPGYELGVKGGYLIIGDGSYTADVQFRRNIKPSSQTSSE